ncbi:phenazine biosynthesis protein PhzF family protein [Salpingoeca rosetta]|uniref:Phenazine biosynthesis protein PhzF family protein n=1 Tax=Salpingoeca rosetta (strain ATCC 50818 / BSB-021) TaxID=946362 RepID=F2U380_SALR5|nr:phenazine biosynthesis protein PhzF family protein [Salpingoeca rosetta]EGD82074.1 phenazine biosynthesis protein PhzF family protein [Salpingoeca rosetta]|eukprot:XP_004996257.1 phenazine biosynthesis protein PhzF family protein [Salpingoeca rosetta]
MRLPSKARFSGNPACVVVLGEQEGANDVTDDFMQKFAREMNLSETAYLRKESGSDNTYSIRWFTPAIEVDLCGHATLAAAHTLFSRGHVTGDSVTFSSKSGPLAARRAEGGLIELDFPQERVAADAEAPPALLKSLNFTVEDVAFVGKNRMDYFVAIAGGQPAIAALAPDFTLMRTIKTRCVIVTSRCDDDDSEYDVVSRVFAPAAGIDEDAVTGSAHSAIGPYWADKLGKASLVARQASARDGTLHLTVKDNGRILIKGNAVTVTRGELLPQEQ